MLTHLQRWRRRELALLLFPIAIGAVGFWVLTQLHVATASGRWWPAFVVAAAGLLANLILTRRAPDADQLLVPVALMLATIGLLEIERLASNFTVRQTAALVGSVALMLVLALWPGILRFLERVRYSLILPGIVLLLLTILVGLTPFGEGQQFLRIGRFSFQPSEPLKLLLVIFLAGYLDFHREKFKSVRLTRLWRDARWLWVYFPLLMMWGFAMLLLVWQRDLGAALLFFGTFLGITYLATQRLDYVLIGFGLFAAGAVAAIQTFSHVATRIAIWQNPWDTGTAGAYQVVQALFAVANGGLIGQGLGQGFPGFVPVVHSDFILVAVAEEFGLAGVLAFIALYLFLMERGFSIALHAPDGFRQLLAGGITLLLCMQALIIMAGTLKLIPLTGVTLPFVSYGGSSLLTSFAALGLLLRVSREM